MYCVCDVLRNTLRSAEARNTAILLMVVLEQIEKVKSRNAVSCSVVRSTTIIFTSIQAVMVRIETVRALPPVCTVIACVVLHPMLRL